jgi:hypothetical protein
VISTTRPRDSARLWVRSALTAVLDNGDDYLDSDVAAEAIAAAALVASQLRGGTKVTSASTPDFVLAGGRLELADDVPDLAVQALDRIVGEDSEWRELSERHRAAQRQQEQDQLPAAPDSEIADLTEDQINAIVDELGGMVTALREAAPKTNWRSTATSGYA